MKIKLPIGSFERTREEGGGIGKITNRRALPTHTHTHAHALAERDRERCETGVGSRNNDPKIVKLTASNLV